MLRSYVRKFRDRICSPAEYFRHSPSWPTVEATFRGFVAVDSNRDSMLATLRAFMRRVAARFDAFVSNEATQSEFSKTLIDVCSRIDGGKIWHEALGLRSYVDVSLQVKAMRALIEHLAVVSTESIAMEPLELTALVLDDFPDNRPALLVHAELLLEHARVDEAIDSIRRALRIDAVCISAQKLLHRGYRMKRDAGSTDPELSILDYDLSDKFCHLPFTHFSTGLRGETFPCSCPAWLPYSIGNVLTAESADEIWNSERAMEIRRSILDGDFSYCSRTLCSFITAQKLPKKDAITDPVLRGYMETHTTRIDELPEFVELNHDPTCNLACPSCRTEIIVSKAEEQDAYARATEKVILPLLEKVKGHAYISGGGEAFASQHFRSILKALNRAAYPGLSLILITNGTMLTRSRWDTYPDLPEMIDILEISLDAARPETYEKLRRPAHWDVAMKNLEHAANMRRAGTLRGLSINFVVQKDNFREMLEFVELGDRFAVDYFWFQRLSSYGSFDQATFARLDVTSPLHPDHAELLEILRHPTMQRKAVLKDQLLPLLPEVVASSSASEYLAKTKRETSNAWNPYSA